MTKRINSLSEYRRFALYSWFLGLELLLWSLEEHLKVVTKTVCKTPFHWEVISVGTTQLQMCW